jgi:hypothetical protein
MAVRRTMTSMCSQSAPSLTMRCASAPSIAKSLDNIDGAIFGAGAAIVQAVLPR